MAATLDQAPSSYNLSLDPIYVKIASDEFSGASAPYTPDQDNLQAYVEVWKKVSGGSDELIVKLHSPYSVNTKKTTFDIRRFFSFLKPGLPEAPGQPAVGDIKYNTADDAFATFYLKYADKYGSPAVAESLTQSSDYEMILGGHTFDSNQTLLDPVKAVLLHNYQRADGGTFEKWVIKSTPDWIYFYTKEAIDLVVSVTMTYMDGTSSTATITTTPVSISGKKIYWLEVGYDYLDLDTRKASGKEIHKWKVSLIDDGVEGSFLEVNYVMDELCHPFNHTMLMPNGCGGVETVRLAGKKKTGYESEKQTFERFRWEDSNAQDGLIQTYNRRGRHVYEASTGFYEEYYIEHLRQMLLGDVWLVDSARDQLVRAIIDTDSIDIAEDNQHLFALTFEYTTAWYDQVWNLH